MILDIRLLGLFHDINNVMKMRGDRMNHQTLKKVEELTIKVNQHEETITQLVEMIAFTNKRLTDLTYSQQQEKSVPQQKNISSQ